MMPASIASPTPMKHSTAATLTMANQYSASPKLRAENAFSPKVRARNATLHIHPGVSGNQYAMTNCAATTSTATTVAQLIQKFHPSAKPKPLST
ncbi:hypothetical protein D9M72_124350 [compost metagenome]